MNTLSPSAEQLFDGFLRFGLIPKAEYGAKTKQALLEYYLSVSEGSDTALSAADHNHALKEKLYPKAEQLLKVMSEEIEGRIDYLHDLGVLPHKQFDERDKKIISDEAQRFFSEFRRSRLFVDMVRRHRNGVEVTHPSTSSEYISGMKAALEKALGYGLESDGS